VAEFFRRLLARWKRHWHCLWGTLGPHRETDIHIDGKIAWIGCECERTFWGDPAAQELCRIQELFGNWRD
jgi:hypothetical protein